MPASRQVDCSQPLATLVRASMDEAHTVATATRGQRLLLAGKLPREEYIRFLMMLWYIYNALEEALDLHASFPTLEPTYNPTLLARAQLISSDIAYLLGVSESEWKAHHIHRRLTTPSIPAPLQAYVARIKTLEGSLDPTLLLAHSYVRYLGDLSGGQAIRRNITKAYGLDDGVAEGKDLGVSFYAFKELRGSKEAGLGEVKRIKEWFKDGMNVAGERCGEHDTKLCIAEEAIHALNLHMGLFSALNLPSEHEDEPASAAFSSAPQPTDKPKTCPFGFGQNRSEGLSGCPFRFGVLQSTSLGVRSWTKVVYASLATACLFVTLVILREAVWSTSVASLFA
ncbi:hypothetical protein NMY22_g8130 [Coprinellus aureogranulatus]|nr:hypothetical protein NMY22_g8130 [Coprinellus aureogranulatus]